MVNVPIIPKELPNEYHFSFNKSSMSMCYSLALKIFRWNNFQVERATKERKRNHFYLCSSYHTRPRMKNGFLPSILLICTVPRSISGATYFKTSCTGIESVSEIPSSVCSPLSNIEVTFLSMISLFIISSKKASISLSSNLTYRAISATLPTIHRSLGLFTPSFTVRSAS